MRHAVSVPNFGAFADPAAIVELASASEVAGWDGFFVWDHILAFDRTPVADPWVLLSAVAAATDRIRLGPLVTPLPRRRPWVVARQAVTLDHLSGGRTVLGVGLGSPPDEEFGVFGEPTADRHRAELLDEALEVVVGMWSGEPFSFRGRHFAVRERTFLPTPVSGIPIWVAATWPNRRPVLRAARFDGVAPMRADMEPIGPGEIRELLALVAAHRHPGTPFDVVVGGPPIPPSRAADFEEAGVTWYVAGPHPGGEPVSTTLAWIREGPVAYVGAASPS